ncbi:hypothetical protein CRENBAI_001921 [Crenichthys baileyi]|uniref:Uncharacterized protein n=1 Tax=Crenichthys baileyi TaxID=28760 RepID=A0AAV9S8Z0_9TELE
MRSHEHSKRREEGNREIPWTPCGVPFVAPGIGTGTRPTGGPVTIPAAPPPPPPDPTPPVAEAVTWTLKSGKILIMVLAGSAALFTLFRLLFLSVSENWDHWEKLVFL